MTAAAIIILCLSPVLIPVALAAIVPRDAREGLAGLGLFFGIFLALLGVALLAGVIGL